MITSRHVLVHEDRERLAEGGEDKTREQETQRSVLNELCANHVSNFGPGSPQVLLVELEREDACAFRIRGSGYSRLIDFRRIMRDEYAAYA